MLTELRTVFQLFIYVFIPKLQNLLSLNQPIEEAVAQ